MDRVSPHISRSDSARLSNLTKGVSLVGVITSIRGRCRGLALGSRNSQARKTDDAHPKTSPSSSGNARRDEKKKKEIKTRGLSRTARRVNTNTRRPHATHLATHLARTLRRSQTPRVLLRAGAPSALPNRTACSLSLSRQRRGLFSFKRAFGTLDLDAFRFARVGVLPELDGELDVEAVVGHEEGEGRTGSPLAATTAVDLRILPRLLELHARKRESESLFLKVVLFRFPTARCFLGGREKKSGRGLRVEMKASTPAKAQGADRCTPSRSSSQLRASSSSSDSFVWFPRRTCPASRVYVSRLVSSLRVGHCIESSHTYAPTRCDFPARA